MSYNIAIDGPAGAGKSTIAKAVAKQLGYIYVDTGAMFRAIGLYLIRQGIKPGEEDKISDAANSVDVTIKYEEGVQQVILNGENVTGLIRTEEVGNMASVCATNKDVRKKLLELQRQLAKTSDVIMDGRDIGTHVLPEADCKIYLTASARVRAERRYKELVEKGTDCNIENIEKDIIERDERDMNREIAPLKQAEDAYLLDSSNMTIEEVIKKIIEISGK